MAQGDRRPIRERRASTRNESCGLGGNEAAEKPRLKSKEETVPVRKPHLRPSTPKPKESRFEEDPSKVRLPKPKAMSLDVDPVKTLAEFNCLVNSLAKTGVRAVQRVGGFSAVSRAQKELLKEMKEMDSLPPELSEAFDTLAAALPKYLRKEVGADGKVRYLYSTMDKKKLGDDHGV